LKKQVDGQTERSLNLIRGILRVSELLMRQPEARSNANFTGFFEQNIFNNTDNPAVRELYD